MGFGRQISLIQKDSEYAEIEKIPGVDIKIKNKTRHKQKKCPTPVDEDRLCKLKMP